jgi:heat-inducible transcriptional repressor
MEAKSRKLSAYFEGSSAMPSKILEGRSRGTLMAVIRTHIQTGEPVGSRTISLLDREGLSPASIRNIMMELEEEGYLEQPHTSAGRIPTDKAYRFYASQYDATHPPGKADELLILSHLDGALDLPEDVFLEKVSRVLSLISNNLGVVVLEPMGTTVVEHIHFARVGEKRVLVVLLSGDSRISRHVVQLDREIPESELVAAARYLNEHFQGWELNKIREQLVAECNQERAAYDTVLRDLRHLYEQGILQNDSPAELFVEGASNLVVQPELAEPGRVRDLLKTLEERETVIRLLTECIRVPGDPLQVVVGLPGKPTLLRGFALIGATFTRHGQIAGRLAVLGPVRMPYERMIRSVGYISRLFERQEELN